MVVFARAASRGASGASRLAGTAPSTSRAIHASPCVQAFSKFAMPAMSPTMTEGGLAAWKVQEGQAFSAGDVLLEIETDKATMDVEAQDDGVMAKIVVQDGEKNVGVGKTIAILAEEGDDLSKAENEVGADEPAKPAKQESQAAPSSSSSSSQQSGKADDTNPSNPATPTPPPSQSHHGTPDFPMFPSVLRLLNESGIAPQDAKGKIRGTGIRGMLTKGDVLVHLGKVKTPTGTWRDEPSGIADLGGPPSGKPAKGGPGASTENSQQKQQKQPEKPMTAQELRAAILGGLATSSRNYRSLQAASALPLANKQQQQQQQQPDPLNQALEDYPSAAPATARGASKPTRDWLDGLI
ncbi:unnamed protein product [Jaminaea pallidilutea]